MTCGECVHFRPTFESTGGVCGCPWSRHYRCFRDRNYEGCDEFESWPF